MEHCRDLHSLIPLADFKAIFGLDDRDDQLSQYCLITATYSIEQYCKRSLLLKNHTDCLNYSGESFIILREYPIRKLLKMWSVELGMRNGNRIKPDLYHLYPDCGIEEDIPFYISLTSALKHSRTLEGIKVCYKAGYSCGEVPADLGSACMELALWNMTRYKGRRIGISGVVRGKGESLEVSMPENVKQLLEPYRRRMI
jgi:uncharacterized phiE125 gp8 family phage protein